MGRSPPYILITAQMNVEYLSSPKIFVEGLDGKCVFDLFLPVSSKGRFIYDVHNDCAFFSF